MMKKTRWLILSFLLLPFLGNLETAIARSLNHGVVNSEIISKTELSAETVSSPTPLSPAEIEKIANALSYN
jgi:hypothetical protein